MKTEAVSLTGTLAPVSVSLRNAVRYVRTGDTKQVTLGLPRKIKDRIHKVIRTGLATRSLVIGSVSADMHRLVLRWPRFGYRRITALLVGEGWRVNVKRVHRLWKEEGLQIRRKARKRRRMGTSANACHRRKPRYKDHMWSYDFVTERTERGGQMKLLSVVDEFTRECR
jgi:hypothetical protein